MPDKIITLRCKKGQTINIINSKQEQIKLHVLKIGRKFIKFGFNAPKTVIIKKPIKGQQNADNMENV